MRKINFRDGVLHAVAYKLGLDPEQSNFLTNEAIPVGTFIDEWVRRTYPARDWPEWTATHKFAPTSHVVPWDAIAIDLVTPPSVVGTLIQIGRVLKVFLVDPSTTDAPVDTPYTIIENGVHVGYEHGQYVWIRYIPTTPKFTAVQWNVSNRYQKDDSVYSYTTGECYRSKVNNNIGKDPVSSGSFTPPPPHIDTTQPWTPDNPGIAERTETMTVHFTMFTDSFSGIPPDPPLSGSVYKVTILDGDGNFIGDSFVTADGIVTINDIIDASVTQMIADLPGTFVVTGDHSTKTMTISDNSVFSPTGATFRNTENVERSFIVDIAPYIPPQASVDGVPQITTITMSVDTTFPGALYTLTVRGSDGMDHEVSYQSSITDGAAQILQGLIFAIEASTDDYWISVDLTFVPTGVTLDLAIKDSASTNIITTVAGSAYWEEIFFPKALADQVIRGAYADLLKEWGQTDKGAMEEQAVPDETSASAEDYSTMPNPELTGQQRSLSRYKV